MSKVFLKSGDLILALCLLWAIGFTLLGCGDDDDEEGEIHFHTFDIMLEDPGHVHAFREASLTFKVIDEDGAPVTDLEPIMGRQFEGDEQMRYTEPNDESVVNHNDGTYSWTRTFNDAGVYVIACKFEVDDITYSNAFPLEVSKAGGERIFCADATNPEFAYQIRWTVTPGHIHAGDEAAFQIDLRRSFNTPVNTEQPWQNQFDHLTPSDLKQGPTAAIGSAAGEIELPVEYKGMGIYEAKYQSEHVSERTTYWLHVTFEDECGPVDESGETEADYQFTVSPGH